MASTDPIKRLLALLTLLVCAFASHSRCIRDEPQTLWNYEGSIADKYRVGMTLVFAGEQVSGLYFYASQLRDIALKGRVVDGMAIELDELDAAGRPVARFEARFQERDPRGRFGNGMLECEIMVGSWQRANAPERLPVFLTLDNSTGGSLSIRYEPAGASDDNLVHRNAFRFWNAVRQGDRKAVAASMAYPISVGLPGGKARLRNAADLLAHYDAVFTDKYREAIANAPPHNMFVRDQGIMLGHGEVWFGPDGRVIALNNF